ncbi:TIM barrel protein [Nanoarchaeota archaeon]
MVKMKLKEALEKNKILTKKELEIVRTAYDMVGSIAIMEIPDELVKKEKKIAEEILKINKQIKTVVKKASEHKGEFRLQKYKIIVGKRTKETIHKENNARIKLHLEKTYFSSRSATERKRIFQQVKPGEDVLVMFSGCGPFTCVIAKNTEARNVFGMEINPDAHNYAMQNLKLNKLHNVVLINGDVNDVVPNIYHYLIGLKSSDSEKQLKTRLLNHPVIMEIHLFDNDLFEGIDKLENAIQDLQAKGIQVVLHMPFHKKNGEKYNLAKENIAEELRMFNILGSLCKQYHIKAIVHPASDSDSKNYEDILVENIMKLSKYYDYFYFENVIDGLFSRTEDIVRIGKKAGIKNICIDTAHLFILYKNNNKIEDHIKEIRKNFNTYFHIADHNNKAHTCEIGKGSIDFSKILPYVNLGVVEVRNKDEKKAKEMIKSYFKVEHNIKKFDRILMPLPKSAEDFLDTALLAAKKGTIIHFYDFLAEDEFNLAKEKVKKACKRNNVKYKILDLVKCGQFSPRVFRICVDFKIL